MTRTMHRRGHIAGAIASRTSVTHPLEIASVQAGPSTGRLGITLCPGKCQARAQTGGWARDLAGDLDAVAGWGAAVVVSLVTERELEQLKVSGLGAAVRARHMAWYHLPLPDGGVPGAGFERVWSEAGRELRQLLRNGCDVLIHCKGGLGRAGTIAARLLIDFGWDAAEALAAVRAVRPVAVETALQEAHLATHVALMDPAPTRTPDARRDRGLGALLGLAIGDAIGTTLEFKPRDTYPPLTDMVGGGPFRLAPGQWTDDTAMALALADSLVTCRGLDEADLMRAFASWLDHGTYSSTGTCFDVGIITRAAIRRWQRTGDPIAGSVDPRSAGNGSLMRLAPVALAYWDAPARLADVAARQSRTTHAARAAAAACVGYGSMVGKAIAGWPIDAVLREAGAPASDPDIRRVLAGSWRHLRRSEVRASGYVVESLEAALWCIARSTTFSQTVLMAANLGEDADTTAAIAGQLAGAIYGMSGIPSEWLARVAQGPQIEARSRALLARTGGVGLAHD